MGRSSNPVSSSARRMRATRPSIMSLGATTSAPALACTTAISARTSRVASLSTSISPSRRLRRMPQWPWSVYSSTQTSVITMRPGRGVLHGGHRLGHRAVGIEPAGSTRVLAAGQAEEDDAPEAVGEGLAGDLPRALDRELEDAGHGADGPRLDRAFVEEQRPHEVARSQGGLADQRAHGRGGAKATGPAQRKGRERHDCRSGIASWP